MSSPDLRPEPVLDLRRGAVGLPARGLAALRGRAGALLVSDATLAIAPGEVVALVGGSGSGKTTLARALIGLRPLLSGELAIAGLRPRSLRDPVWRTIRRSVGFMAQDPAASLDPRMTVARSVLEPLAVHGPAAGPPRSAAELLDMVGLSRALLERRPHELSGGQARRVTLARALALRPQLLIADEPTAGLDVSVQGDLLNLLGDLRRELGLSALIVTHNLAVARLVSDQVAVMEAGRIIERGPTERIFSAPAQAGTRELLLAARPLAAAQIDAKAPGFSGVAGS